MMRIVLAMALSAGAVCGQTAPPPAFDVASVKVSASGQRGGNPILNQNIRATTGSLTMRHVTLKACIQWAYHVFEYQVSGPNWIDSDHYDIAAKAAGPATEPELRLMLQTLLADRFQLAFHRQTTEKQAYVLSVGKNGPKFHESAEDGESDIQPDQKTMSVSVRRVSISQLIDPLSHMFQMPVVDMTGLNGRYDVAISMAKYIPQSGDRADPISIIQTALEEDLGLKLEARKMPLDYLIVDRAARVPSGN
ncbi:MAG: TIGR03435 family protein [Candidatus Sulfopaludibacter sp.]|nr:TIGR03435 family protein [Candidatus Sulfopaludibacter sp.]